jgi:hypothetical protein
MTHKTDRAVDFIDRRFDVTSSLGTERTGEPPVKLEPGPMESLDECACELKVNPLPVSNHCSSRRFLG